MIIRMIQKEKARQETFQRQIIENSEYPHVQTSIRAMTYCHKESLTNLKEFLEERLHYFYGEKRYIDWARGNGMADTIYDDYKGNFRREFNDIKKAIEEITKIIESYAYRDNGD